MLDTNAEQLPTTAGEGTRNGHPVNAVLDDAPVIDISGRLEERALFMRVAGGDVSARDALVERFLPLARHLAHRYARSDEPFEDLFQVACLGLVKAIDRFDADRGIAFTSYATPTISGELKRHYRDRTWSVRVPRALQELALEVEKTTGVLAARLGRQPTVSDVASELAARPEDVLDALAAGQAHWAASLHAPRGPTEEESGDTLGDMVGGDDDGYSRAEDRALLAALLPQLDDRDRAIIFLRFEQDLTQAQIGARLGLSQMHVSRILRQCLARLRVAAGRDAPA